MSSCSSSTNPPAGSNGGFCSEVELFSLKTFQASKVVKYLP